MAKRPRYKRVTRKRRYRRRRTTQRRTRGRKSNFAQRVKRVIYGLSEAKNSFYDAEDVVCGSPLMADWTTENVQQLTPSDAGGSWNVGSQGTGQGQRVGNEIRVTSHKVKMAIYPSDNGLNKPFYLRIIICSVKIRANDTPAGLKTIMTTSCFQRGSTSVGMASYLDDFVEQWNRDVLTIHKVKEFKMGTSNPTQGGTANNDFSYGRRWSVNVHKYYKRAIKYNDTGTSPQINRNVYMVFQVAAADGSIATGDTRWCHIHHGHYINYRDL